MDVINKYGNFIKNKIEKDPSAAKKMLGLGLTYESSRLQTVPDKNIPKALNTLNLLSVNSVKHALKNPESTVWVNLFAPVELLLSFGLSPLSIECFSSFLGGFRIEDYFLKHAENLGMSDTLCSYHKAFIGVTDTGVLPSPLMNLTTTLACDCNVNTFRFISEKQNVDSFFLDIPYEYNEESEEYVVRQLKNLISTLEGKLGVNFDETKLQEVLERENLSRELHAKALTMQSTKNYPSTLTLQMFKLFATHLIPGSVEALDYYLELVEDMKTYPDSDAMRILWVHLLPYYQESLKKYFNLNPDFRIIGSDFDIDYREKMNTNKPLHALARKMLLNMFNGPFERKIHAVEALADELKPDGIIHFCHWGCKQSSGGVMEMKRVFDDKNIPFLILDGDGIDRRNSHDGQISTRTEAFFEMLEKKKSLRGETNNEKG